jgi:hypothetical protein
MFTNCYTLYACLAGCLQNENSRDRLTLPRLYGQPIVNVATIQKWTGFTRAGAQIVIDRFIEKGILTPKDEDKKYGQSYVYKEYLDIFTGND